MSLKDCNKKFSYRDDEYNLQVIYCYLQDMWGVNNLELSIEGGKNKRCLNVKKYLERSIEMIEERYTELKSEKKCQ